MKYRWTLASVLVVAGQVGCQSSTPVNRDLKPKGPVNQFQRETNKSITHTLEDEFVAAAVIREHTLYPYHFVDHGASLNELGWHDARLLAAHYVSNPGPLNVRQGGAPEELYKARVRTVINAMTAGGVKMDRIKVADGLPGGDGMSSDQVVVIVEGMRQDTGAITSDKDKTKSGSSTGTSESSSPMGSKPAGTGTSTGGQY